MIFPPRPLRAARPGAISRVPFQRSSAGLRAYLMPSPKSTRRHRSLPKDGDPPKEMRDELPKTDLCRTRKPAFVSWSQSAAGEARSSSGRLGISTNRRTRTLNIGKKGWVRPSRWFPWKFSTPSTPRSASQGKDVRKAATFWAALSMAIRCVSGPSARRTRTRRPPNRLSWNCWSDQDQASKSRRRIGP